MEKNSDFNSQRLVFGVYLVQFFSPLNHKMFELVAPREIKHTHTQNCTTAVTGKNKTEPTSRDTFTSLECIAVCFLFYLLVKAFVFLYFLG